jgi:hypothetical protein
MSGAAIMAKLGAYLPAILLVLSAGVLVIAYRSWHDMHDTDEPIKSTDLLADLERGDAASKMTDEEFRRVRDLLLGAGTPGKTGQRPGRCGPDGDGGNDAESQTGIDAT